MCGTRKGESAVGNKGEKHGEHDQGTNEQGDDRDNKSSRQRLEEEKGVYNNRAKQQELEMGAINININTPPTFDDLTITTQQKTHNT